MPFVATYSTFPEDFMEDCQWLNRARDGGRVALLLSLPPGVTIRDVKDALKQSGLRDHEVA